MKVNTKRKKMYLDGEVGIRYNADNSGDRLEMLGKICGGGMKGIYDTYNRGSNQPMPLSWFFEPDEPKKDDPALYWVMGNPGDVPPQVTPRTPTAWRLNIDVPQWGLKKEQMSTNENNSFGFFSPHWIPSAILQHIATPIYTTPFTLESGQEVELSEIDIEQIKLLS